MLNLSRIVVDKGTFLINRNVMGLPYLSGLTLEEQKELYRAIQTLRLTMEGELGGQNGTERKREDED